MEPEDFFAALVEGQERLTRFLMCYDFAIQEIETKISILRQEFQQIHRYNPIEHVSSRLKEPDQIIAKARRLGCSPDEASLAANIRDIAGVRVVCSFVSDVYRVQRLLCDQDDIEVLELKDYVSQPKASGYRSLHAIVTVPVFLSDRVERVPVEVQFRTIAQDFWASLEHKIFYKYDRQVPPQLTAELVEAAGTAADLDARMERLGEEIQHLSSDDSQPLVSDDDVRSFLDFVRGSGQS